MNEIRRIREKEEKKEKKAVSQNGTAEKFCPQKAKAAGNSMIKMIRQFHLDSDVRKKRMREQNRKRDTGIPVFSLSFDFDSLTSPGVLMSRMPLLLLLLIIFPFLVRPEIADDAR